jgi:hypothetical protein
LSFTERLLPLRRRKTKNKTSQGQFGLFSQNQQHPTSFPPTW